MMKAIFNEIASKIFQEPRKHYKMCQIISKTPGIGSEQCVPKEEKKGMKTNKILQRNKCNTLDMEKEVKEPKEQTPKNK